MLVFSLSRIILSLRYVSMGIALNIRNATAVMGAFARNKYCADYHNNALLAGAFANPDNPLSLMPPNRTHLTA